MHRYHSRHGLNVKIMLTIYLTHDSFPSTRRGRSIELFPRQAIGRNNDASKNDERKKSLIKIDDMQRDGWEGTINLRFHFTKINLRSFSTASHGCLK